MRVPSGSARWAARGQREPWGRQAFRPELPVQVPGRLRVQAARRLIVAGVPLAEAALTAGFTDQSHMNRVFLRHTGATPGAWASATA